MRDVDYINTYFNMILDNELAYVRDIVSSYEYVQEFLNWLKQYQINIPTMTQMSEDDLRILGQCKKVTDIDHLLHISLSSDIETLRQTYKDAIHVLIIPGLNQDIKYDIPYLFNKNIYIYQINDILDQQDLSFFDPFSALFTALNDVEKWPGVLIFNQTQSVFHPINNQKDIDDILKNIEEGKDVFDLYQDKEDVSYFIQISDLHLGRKKGNKGLMQLHNSLDDLINRLHSSYPIKFLITGDLMDSPNRKNMYLANDFMNDLKKKYKADVTFILGNHDVIVHGFNFARNQKSKVIAYLLGENIKVLEKEKVIIIKMDTTSEGNLARGKVGQRQLQEIDDELSAIENIDDYTKIVMLHHHVYPINKAQFIKTKWHEKTFINKIVETSKVLVDAPILIQWLEDHDIQYVFHGHKHLPFFQEKDNKYYIAGGSSTGSLKESRSRYISYNVLKYDHHTHHMNSCMIFYDDKAKAERQRVEVYLFKEDSHENS